MIAVTNHPDGPLGATADSVLSLLAGEEQGGIACKTYQATMAVLLAVLPLPAHAMDVATFLAKADPLKKKGMMAIFSSDYKLLAGEVQTHSKALREERLAAKAAGRPQAYCPPEKSGLKVDELMAGLHAIPAAQQPRTSMKDALKALLVRKYPCR